MNSKHKNPIYLANKLFASKLGKAVTIGLIAYGTYYETSQMDVSFNQESIKNNYSSESQSNSNDLQKNFVSGLEKLL